MWCCRFQSSHLVPEAMYVAGYEKPLGSIRKEDISGDSSASCLRLCFCAWSVTARVTEISPDLVDRFGGGG